MISRVTYMTSVLALVCGVVTVVQASDGPKEPTLDTNGDGSVDFAELQARRPDVTLKRFQALDLDGNGLLGREELAAARKAGKLDALPTPPSVDADQSRKELQTVGPPAPKDRASKREKKDDGNAELSGEDLRQVLQALDTDGDGKVSFEEQRNGRMRAVPEDRAPNDKSKQATSAATPR